VRARGEVQRSAFGMDARRVVLGDRVRLDFAIRALPAAPPAPDAG
jgi:polyisoprenoid-binding protein YceI